MVLWPPLDLALKENSCILKALGQGIKADCKSLADFV